MKIRFAGIGIFAALALFVALGQPFAPSLGQQGHFVLAAMIVTVGLWIFALKWIPYSVSSMVLLLLIVAAGVKYSVAFNGFTGRAIWILIPALFFGFALNKTGLGRRMAYWVIRLFKPSYLTLTLSWVIIGLALSVLTPSISVRIAIVVPIAAATIEICKLKGGTAGAGLLMLTAWSMAIIPGGGWLTGSLWGPIAIGFFGSTPGLENVITFNSWLQAMLLPSILLSGLFILGIYKYMKPKTELKIEPAVFTQEYQALGPMRFQEKATFAILLITFALLVTVQIHNIPDVSICLGAFVLLAACGVIGTKDIGPAISWDLVLFLGTVMGLGTVFNEVSISSFLSSSFTPVLNLLAANPWVLLFILLVALFIWRFLDAAQLYATMPFLVPILPLLAAGYGIHPLVVFSIFVMTGNCFFVAYQQPFVMLGQSLANGMIWTPGQLARAGMIYAAACFITLAVAIPYWMMVGFIR